MVAEEVRTLAIRTQKSTQEIETIIDQLSETLNDITERFSFNSHNNKGGAIAPLGVIKQTLTINRHLCPYGGDRLHPHQLHHLPPVASDPRHQ